MRQRDEPPVPPAGNPKTPPPAPDKKYVSRGGLKLAHALDKFRVDPAGLTCADFGCSTGGFTDCLLQHGAARVYALDTAYGQLAWTLRTDPRVTVMERTSCLHAAPPTGGVDLIVIDAGWTPQRLLIPAALRWLKPAHNARIITLIKPHYEDKPAADAHRGVLPDELGAAVVARVLSELPVLAVRVAASTPSPIRGLVGKSARGNLEYLALLERARENRPRRASGFTGLLSPRL
ncbi:N/A [soil metagenome]